MMKSLKRNKDSLELITSYSYMNKAIYEQVVHWTTQS